MARIGVTYQDISVAANELKGLGKNVTIENVRNILGTGSIGTINQHLRKWKAAQTATPPLANQENIPESLIALTKGLWENLLSQSSAQFQTLEKKYQHEIADLNTELTKYKTNNQRWQKMYNQWQQEKLGLANEKLVLEQALECANKEIATLNIKQEGFQQQLQEKQERNEELQRLHTQTQNNLEHYRESAREQRLLDKDQFERDKQQWLAEIKLLKEENIYNQKEIFSLKGENDSLSARNLIQEKNNMALQKETEQLKFELKAFEKKYDSYVAVYDANQSQYKEMLVTMNEQAKQLINHQAENKILSNKIEYLTKSMQSTKDQLKLAAQEKWELIQEKSILEGQLKQLHMIK